MPHGLFEPRRSRHMHQRRLEREGDVREIRDRRSNDIPNYIVNKAVFAYSDGLVSMPQAHRLGVEVDENNVIERIREGHHWRIRSGTMRMAAFSKGKRQQTTAVAI